MKVTHISFWPPDDDRVPTVTLPKGIVTDEDGRTRLAVSDGLARSRGLPDDVTGWRVFVSRLDGDGTIEHVYDGRVSRIERVAGMAGRRRVFHCHPGGLTV